MCNECTQLLQIAQKLDKFVARLLNREPVQEFWKKAPHSKITTNDTHATQSFLKETKTNTNYKWKETTKWKNTRGLNSVQKCHARVPQETALEK